ncbi:MAG: lasso peptide biosynthesis B2 protein [Pseudomonadota bacterium]
MKLLFRKWHSFNRLAFVDRLLLLPLWIMLGMARLTIIALPFPLVRRWLGGERQSTPWLHCLSARKEHRARRLGRLIRLMARYTPWTSNCFPQALVARTALTLAGLPHTVFFGLRRENGEMQAHAWVMSGRIAVTGGNSFEQFTIVGCFNWPAEQGQR